MDNNLNIVTYNIQHGTKADEIVRNILALAYQKVDLFCLQEVRRPIDQKFIVDELLQRLGRHWQAESLISLHKFDLGLCTLWNSNKLKALNFDQLLLPKLIRLNTSEKLFIEWRLRHEKVYSSDIKPIQRAALIGEFAMKGQTIRVTNMHLDWQGGFKHQSLQLEELKTHLKSKAPVECEILCGDFNTIGFYRFANGRLKKVKNLLGGEFVNSFHNKPTTNHLQMLDHIFVKNLKIAKTEILKYTGSDHFPLLAEIII